MAYGLIVRTVFSYMIFINMLTFPLVAEILSLVAILICFVIRLRWLIK
jgi:hypothetical protein